MTFDFSDEFYAKREARSKSIEPLFLRSDHFFDLFVVHTPIGRVLGSRQGDGHQFFSGRKIIHGHTHRVFGGSAPADHIGLIGDVLGRAAGHGKLVVEAVGAHRCGGLLLRIQQVRAEAGHPVFVAVVKDGKVAAIEGGVMLAGCFFGVGQAKLVAVSGEEPQDLSVLVRAVQTEDGVEVPEGADQIAVLVQPHGVEVDIVGNICVLVCKVVGRLGGISHRERIQLGVVDAFLLPDDLTVLHLL